ncbi:MAG TPA: sulfotransferase [Streptosporangiaceae bacterium]|jgi:hypothetical protein|nr:sulfotransferase [Streptosporangiaceae bacterium]
MELFVVGSGRCGSTLLGNMLDKHPDLCTISEFFSALDRFEVFSAAAVPGETFASFLDRPDISSELFVNRGIIPVELMTTSSGGVPPLMIATLPGKFTDPAAVYAEILAKVRAFPRQTYKQHYEALFGLLMERTGTRYWLERSGLSVDNLAEYYRMYPEGKYVFLHRDGPDSAMSMMKHLSFEWYISEHFCPLTREEILATEYGGQAVSDRDPITVRLSPDYMPLEKYAEYWSYQQILGFKTLAQMNPDQFIMVRYEDVLSDTGATLRRIAEFFGLPERDGWVDEASAMIVSSHASEFEALPRATREAVKRACEAGERLLGRRASPWDVCRSRTMWNDSFRV